MIARLLQTLLRRYAETEAEAIAPFLVGKRLLDLGAGEGYVTAALQRRTDIWACAVDIGPYQRVPVSYLIYDGARLPFDDATFDTTLILFYWRCITALILKPFWMKPCALPVHD